MNIEISTIQRRYLSLRVLNPRRVARLAASLALEGQRAPVLIAPGLVLVDGYHRLAALDSLGLDLVTVAQLDVPEAEALVMAWRLETGRRKSALEQGWMLQALVELHGRSQASLAAELQRPRSWVSQRLGMVRALPVGVQHAVRQGRIPVEAAVKSLVPMARIDAPACERLIEGLPKGVSRRQIEQLYRAWKQADPQGRQRIVEHPALFLKTEEAQDQNDPSQEERFAAELEAISAMCSRARRQAAAMFGRPNTLVQRCWGQAEQAMLSLLEEVDRARP